MADRKRSGSAEVESGDGPKRRNIPAPEAPAKQPPRPWEASANESITCHLVRLAQDLDGGSLGGGLTFKPEFTHQHFGDGELIYGYKGLQVNIYFHAVTFHAYVTIEYQECKKGGGLKAVDVLKVLKDNMPGGVMESREAYLGLLSQAQGVDIAQYGQQMTSYTVRDQGQGQASAMECQILRCALEDETVRAWFERLQAVTLFHIDGGRLLPLDDPNWEVFVALERGRDEAGQSTLHVAGFCTVYSFYAYPDSTRMRLAQMLVLPPFRRRGHAGHLLEQVFAEAARRGCYDVTVEDPNEDFQRLRDVHDMRRLAASPAFSEAVADAVGALGASNGASHVKGVAGSLLSVPPRLVAQLRERFQVTKNQAKRLFELAVYGAVRGDAALLQAFRSRILLRLKQGYESDAVGSSAANKVLEETETGFIMMPRTALARASGALATPAAVPGTLADNEAASSGPRSGNARVGDALSDGEGSEDGGQAGSAPDAPIELTSEERATRAQEDYEALLESYDLVLQRL